MKIYAVTSYYDEADNKAFISKEKAKEYCYKLYNTYADREDRWEMHYDSLKDEYEMDIVDKVIPEKTTYEEYVKDLIENDGLDMFSIEEMEVIE